MSHCPPPKGGWCALQQPHTTPPTRGPPARDSEPMSRQRQKGTSFETAVCTVLAPWFPYCERRALRGANDGGDIAGLPVVIECKNTKAIDLAGACTEAEAAGKRCGVPWAAVIKRPRRGDPADAYTIIPLSFFAELLHVWDHHQPHEPKRGAA